MRKRFMACCSAFRCCGAVASCGIASAEGEYPNQMVRIVVPFSAGSITDGLARIFADKLGARVEATGHRRESARPRRHDRRREGRARRLHADADLQWPHHRGVSSTKSLQFDPVKDFAGVTQVAAVPLVDDRSAGLSGKTLKEFIALAKEKPGP